MRFRIERVIILKAICVDIGGTAIKYGLVQQNNDVSNIEIIEKKSYDWSPAEVGGPGVSKLVFSLITDMLSQYTVDFIGVSTAGMVDPAKGRIKYANENIPHYTGVPLKEELEQLTGCRVAVENDVNCVALAENFCGSAKGTQSSICLTIGTGIGGGLVISDELWRGSNFGAMEVGYMPLKAGSFDRLASTSGLVDRCKARLDSNAPLNGEKIFDLAINQDCVICQEEIDRMIDYLVEGIGNLIFVIDPEVIVLGGGIMHQSDYLIPRIQEKLDGVTKSKVDVRPAKHLNNAGLIGAFYNARQQFNG